MKILHPDNAKVIEAPENMPDCQPLPVVIEPDGMASFWQPEPIEIEALQRGGSVFLKVRSNVHPVVQIGVVEYPGTLATDPYDEALERAADKFAAQWSSESSNAQGAAIDAFEAGARWQAARPMEITFEPLDWKVHDEFVQFASDPATEKVLIVSEHDGVVFYGPHAFNGFESGKSMEETKADLQKRRDTHLSKLISFGLAS